MPSGEHESPIELAKLDPGLLVWLAGLFNIEISNYHHVRPYANDIRVLVPHTYHTDSILLFCDQDDQPLLAVVWEPHRDDNDDRLPTWKLAQANPSVAVFSALCHGEDRTIDEMFPALAAAMRTLGPTKAIAYYESSWPACRWRLGPDGRRI